MKTLCLYLFAITMSFGGARPLPAQEGYVVIVHASNPGTAMRSADVSKLFLRKTTKWPNGTKAQPIDLGVSAIARRKFSDSVHQMDVPSIKSYWQELVFSGRGEPPPERPSDADIVEYVRANKGAIGYVAIAPNTPGVKVLAVIR
jgi:ABC-type phosphate transport system substrate-binding protein